MPLFRLALPAASLLAFVACSAPAPTAAPGGSQATSAPATRPASSPAPSSPAPAGSPAPGGAPAASSAGAQNDAEALQELRATRDGYLQAQAALQAGRREDALGLMNTAYVEHFERIEPYMDRRFSQDYRQEVEAAISRDIRRRLRDGAATEEVLAQFPAGFTKLDEAEARLSGR